MEDRQEMTLEKYDFQVKNRYRARGAVLLDTNEGPLLLREQNRITGHFALENEIKEHLRQQGMIHLDFAVANREGELVTEWDTGEKYVVYRWFRGDSLPTLENIYALSVLLGVAIDELLVREESTLSA